MTMHLFHLEKVEQEKLFYAVVSVVGRPLSFMHIGCDDGWLVRAAWQLMARPALGIARERPDVPWGRRVIERDYTQPMLDVRGQYDLVLALDEHTHWPSVTRLIAHDGHLVVSQDSAVEEGTRLTFDEGLTERLERMRTQLEIYTCRDY